MLPRDGSSVALVKVVAQDVQGKPLQGQRFELSASAGTLSATEGTTNASGETVVSFTAPDISQNVTSVTISATSVGENAQNSTARTTSIRLTGPAVPDASFTFTPDSPKAQDLATFDASATKVAGAPCNDSCTYAWDFGDSATGVGRLVTHRFAAAGSYNVRLTVTSATGLTSSSSRIVSVGAPAAITAEFTISPTDPTASQTVFFNGSSSKTPDGVAIVSYTWDFGNGSVATGGSVSTSFPSANTYTIRLTIEDALGRTATAIKTLTVK
ncbi:MAG TPA: PKD domain-containing protein [Vicinamibacterales bacterium]|nr:PKD domain-containing protein [Vicinamibacterales bacterium]